ncbi:hypothetical protein A6R68_00018 [Neotoma lepida]|uniref:Toll-like receptor 7 n=1 Tax=Neotoma lepida TaxID=56216 RepID=A0A1A6GZ66_NEOLE|nr:hypothetical protein A6R68_00018 [Neotoma lepida]
MASSGVTVSTSGTANEAPKAPDNVGDWLCCVYRFSTNQNDFQRNLILNLGLFAAGVWLARNLNFTKTHVIVDCTDKHLTEIPEGIPTNTTNLTLTINHIPSISPDSFRRLNHLEEIDFRCNCVPVLLGSKANVCTKRLQIGPGSFSGLSDLKALYLDGNQLLEIPQDLPSSLQLLSLEANNIFSITKENLTELVNIEALYLGNTIGQTLNGSEFQPLRELRYLDFSNNRLDLLYSTAFEELHNLEVLDLSSNSHYFQAEGITHMLNFTKKLQSLKKLMMNDNDISTSASRTMESDSLKVLEFRGNHLDVLWKDGDNRYLDFFKNLFNLEELDISRNSLNSLPPGVFEAIHGLEMVPLKLAVTS